MSTAAPSRRARTALGSGAMPLPRELYAVAPRIPVEVRLPGDLGSILVDHEGQDVLDAIMTGEHPVKLSRRARAFLGAILDTARAAQPTS